MLTEPTIEEATALAKRWATVDDLSPDEQEALFVWVRNRMAKDAPAPFEWLTVGVASDLGIVDGCGTAWALCEEAGWPS